MMSKSHILLCSCAALALASFDATGVAAKGTVTKWSKITGTVNKVKITLFSAPVNNTGVFRIATGSDGNLWFSESAADAVVKFTTAGKATTYDAPAGAKPEGLALGADGNIWFAEFTNPYIDTITPKGVIKRIAISANPSESCGLALGSDGNIYVATDSDGIFSITPKGVVGQVSTGDDGAQPVGLGVGPDKNMWFIDVSGPDIGKVTPKFQVSAYSSGIAGGANWGIAGGADGRMWYTDEANHFVDAINVNGTGLTQYPVTNGTPNMIVAGPDGNLYVGEADGYIDKITTSGAVTRYQLPGNPGTNFVINGMTVGPDGNIWFANDVAAQVGVFELKK
jgi:streptogramin lyase